MSPQNPKNSQAEHKTTLITGIISRYLFPGLLAVLTVLFLSQAISSTQVTGASLVPNRPFPQHETYAAGTIRPTNFTQAQQDQHVRDFYDYWKSSYVVSAGTNGMGQQMYRVSFGSTNPTVTVSEGQGYGMVTVALMAGHDADAQAVFDGLWRFARNYPSGIDSRLMSWKIQNGVIVGGNDSAFDGDVDIAYGLLLADAQWGSSGEINYKAEADTVIAGILDSTIGADSRLPKLGDWTSDNGSPYSQYTPRSSDFMPSHFRAFGRATNDTTWETVISNSQAVIDEIQDNHSSTTGLLPDFIINCSDVNNCEPAGSGFLEGQYDGHYYYNAGRDPWRIGLDGLLNGDTTSKDQVLEMVNWVASDSGSNPNNIKAGYQLNGSAIGTYFTTFFVAPFGVGAMLDASHQQFLNNIYASVYNTQENYYEDSVNMLALLVMTGNYWDPTANYTPPPTNTPGPSPTPTITLTPSNTPTPTNTATLTSTPEGGIGCQVNYHINNDWGTGFTADPVTITNNTGNDLNSWTLTWTFPGNQQIVNLWNGIDTQNGQQVVVNNESWNGSLPNGGTVSFGFQASYSGTNDDPTDFALNGIACNQQGNTPTPTATSTSTPTATNTSTPMATNTPMPTATNTPTTTFPLSLDIGWNSISLPLEPLSPLTASDLCDEINAQGGNALEIDRWHLGGWDGHICGQPFNDFEILLGASYFIKSSRASTWTIEGLIIEATPLTLQVGWNSIGIPHTDAYTAESLCDDMIAQGVMALEIDRWYNGGWEGHICGLPFNDFNIERGVGYFVKSSSSGTITPSEVLTGR